MTRQLLLFTVISVVLIPLFLVFPGLNIGTDKGADDGIVIQGPICSTYGESTPTYDARKYGFPLAHKVAYQSSLTTECDGQKVVKKSVPVVQSYPMAIVVDSLVAVIIGAIIVKVSTKSPRLTTRTVVKKSK